MVYPAKLPPAGELRRMYLVGNQTLNELGAQYGVAGTTVQTKLRRHAVKEGLSWPLRSAVPGWRTRAQQKRHDTVRTDLLRDEMLDAKAEHGVTIAGIAARAGVSVDYARHIACGLKTRVSRRTAEALVAALDAIDRDASGVEWSDLSIDDRRAVVAELIAAGYSSRSIADRFDVGRGAIDNDRRKQAA